MEESCPIRSIAISVDRAERIMIDYAEETHLEYDELSTVFGDILADLRHLATARGVDFYGAVDMSYIHYCEERDNAQHATQFDESENNPEKEDA